jgi:hypothetical protein
MVLTKVVLLELRVANRVRFKFKTAPFKYQDIGFFIHKVIRFETIR